MPFFPGGRLGPRVLGLLLPRELGSEAGSDSSARRVVFGQQMYETLTKRVYYFFSYD